MSRMTVATTCMQVMHDKHKNLERMLAWVDQAADQGARLVVFPEQVLQGYLFHMRNLYNEQYDYQYANAETVPDGPLRAVPDSEGGGAADLRGIRHDGAGFPGAGYTV